MQKRPNILFFLTDDQRFDTIRALGNEHIHTPNIDALIAEGTVFTHAHIPGGTVGAICMPSRAMLNTGRTLFHIKDSGESIPNEHVLLGETLKQEGYNTFGTGKWHNGKDAFSRSFNDGAEIYFGGMADHWNVPAYHFDPTGKYDMTKVVKDPFNSNEVSKQNFDHITGGKHSSELFCEASIEWLNNYVSDNPFYMYISLLAPHDPRTMPDEFLNMYDPEDIVLPPSFMEEYEFDFGVCGIRAEKLAAYPRQRAEIKRHIAEYYGMISHLDHEFGKVVQALKDNGLYDNTVIIFASDNGLALGQHAYMAKQYCYEHALRVPLIFAGNGIPKGEVRSQFAYIHEIFPTICDMIGIDTPETVEGESLLPIMQNNIKGRKYLYGGYGGLCRSVKDSRYKLIEYRYDGKQRRQLFDLQNDPYEINDISSDGEYADKIVELETKMREFGTEWDDTTHEIGRDFWDNY